jgi:hypothetical protein
VESDVSMEDDPASSDLNESVTPMPDIILTNFEEDGVIVQEEIIVEILEIQ